MLPIRGLKVLEVVCAFKIELLEVFGKDDDGIADEEVSKVGGKTFVHAAFNELLLDFRVNYEVGVEVLFS